MDSIIESLDKADILLLSVVAKGDRVIVLNTSRLWRDDFVKAMVQHTLKKVGADIISYIHRTANIFYLYKMCGRVFNEWDS